MTFNQHLIQKARKGEIAILNDGSVEELGALVEEIWPGDFPPSKHASNKYFIAHPNNKKVWYNTYEIEIPAHSVKDFFMPDIKDLSSVPVMQVEQPRTYKVTRGQMKEIYESSRNGWYVVYKIMWDSFGLFGDEAMLTDVQVSMLNSIVPDPDVLKKYFPEYFYIPEGEPVLVRVMGSNEWRIRISDGKGNAYDEGQLSGHSTHWQETIPFTKNPPK